MSRDLLFVALALFTWGMGESAYVFFQPLYLEQLGASPIVIGTILGGVGIAMTIAHIPAGYLADRFGRRLMMWAAWFTGVTAGIFMAAAKTLPVFTIGVLLYGITMFVVSPMNSYITAARGKWSMGRALTFTSAAYNAGAILGPTLGGIIGNQFGLGRIYIFATSVFILSTIIILQIKPQPVKFEHKKIPLKTVLTPNYIRFLPVFFLAIFAGYLAQPLAPNFLQNTKSLSIQQIGSLGSIGSIGAVLLSLILGSINPKFGFILGQILVASFAALLWKGSGFSWYALGYFCLGGFRAGKSMATAHIGSLITPETMGLAYGIAETFGGLALMLAPPLAGLLYNQNPLLVFQIAIIAIIGSIISSSIFTRQPEVALTPEGEPHGNVT
jgi:MFS transporter, DHA1 family, multidrug resistance protein